MTQRRRTADHPTDAGRPPAITEPIPRLLTSAEAAAFLTLKESTLRDYSRRGLLPSVKIGRHLRFVEADLVRYLDGLRSAVQDPHMTTGFGRRSGRRTAKSPPSAK